jgi:hypothetical protein
MEISTKRSRGSRARMHGDIGILSGGAEMMGAVAVMLASPSIASNSRLDPSVGPTSELRARGTLSLLDGVC